MVANGTYLRQPSQWLNGKTVLADAPVDPSFVYNFTKPVIVDPDNPTTNDNVGWDGSALTLVTTDTVIASGQTVTNKLFRCVVTFTDATSKAVNCKFEGKVGAAVGSGNGAINGGSGGVLTRCTIRGTASTSRWDLNGVSSSGGNWVADRCSFSRFVDAIHANGSGFWTIKGCHFDNYAFYNTDTDHSSDGPHPNWSHGDAFQRLSGSGGDQITGSVIRGFFDRTGVLGATVGSYSGGLIGTPSVAMNGDGNGTYGTSSYPDGNYSNGLSWTNAYNYNGVYVGYNWLDGCSYPSALIQMPTSGGGTNTIKIEGNRFGLGGKFSAANKMFLVTGNSITIDWSGTPNVFDDDDDVALALRGTSITTTGTGASITTAPLPAFTLRVTKPTAANTGVQAGIALTNYAGDMTITAAGTVVENMKIAGRVLVRAANVTIRNCEITGVVTYASSANTGLIDCNHPSVLNCVIEFCTLHMTDPNVWHNGVIGHDYVARRNLVYDVVDGFGIYNSNNPHQNDDVKVNLEGNCVTRLAYFTPDVNHTDNRTHNDCVQIQGGTNPNVIGNYFGGYCQTGSYIGSDGNPIFGSNPLASGAYTNPANGATGTYARDTYYFSTGRPLITGHAITFTPTLKDTGGNPIGYISNALIESNWVEGGAGGLIVVSNANIGYPLAPGIVATIKNNRFGRDSYFSTTPYQITNDIVFASSGNVWVDDGTVIAANASYAPGSI